MISKDTALAAARFIHRAGPSITSLSVSFCNGSSICADAEDAFCAAADFSTLTRLEVLELGSLSISSVYHGRHLSARHVPRVLAQVHSENIRVVQFRVTMLAPEDLLMLDLDAIARVLNRRNYRNLEQVVFRYIRHEAMEGTTRLLDEKLGAMLKRTVRIVCHGLLL